eukprot:CAMPEP_0170523752 /NCGR_PEP_ID=MMETSP0209-20121228/9191_1 /TAXON_ID=665100 ORGANISM="Litonotus pictus, Strain P1" /NCGR_SAMPLE_ID=MMETSP0209 /ASSEMBLY_ACC=CAM_ASM_000301 /LENGTH=205 /DNA_ID=CAMNT_0010812031 /DNA_START=211 /DNA_END=825 /DNA_ORIENTATION=-
MERNASSSSLSSILSNNSQAKYNNSNQMGYKKEPLNSDLNKNNILIKLNAEEEGSKKKGLNLKQLFDLSSELIEDVESYYMNGLINIFRHYTRLGEKINPTNLLSFSSWLRIFQDVGVVERRHISALYINKQLIFNKGLIDYHNSMNNSVQEKGFSGKTLNTNEVLLVYIDLTGKKNYKENSVKNVFDSRNVMKMESKNVQSKMG